MFNLKSLTCDLLVSHILCVMFWKFHLLSLVTVRERKAAAWPTEDGAVWREAQWGAGGAQTEGAGHGERAGDIFRPGQAQSRGWEQEAGILLWRLLFVCQIKLVTSFLSQDLLIASFASFTSVRFYSLKLSLYFDSHRKLMEDKLLHKLTRICFVNVVNGLFCFLK